MNKLCRTEFAFSHYQQRDCSASAMHLTGETGIQRYMEARQAKSAHSEARPTSGEDFAQTFRISQIAVGGRCSRCFLLINFSAAFIFIFMHFLEFRCWGRACRRFFQAQDDRTLEALLVS
jgi:hypothetical protein